MNQDFSQMNVANCKKHPEMVICFIFCKPNCPYESRLACIKCMKGYNTFNGFEEILDILNNPKLILQDKYQTDPEVFIILNQYFNLLESDGEVFIRLLKEDIQKQIQKLEQELKDGIEKYKKFKEEIQQAKKQFYEELGHEQLRQAFKDIVKQEMYHQSKEWEKLEQKVQNFVLFGNQKTLKFKQSCQKLMFMEQTCLQPKLLSDILNREQSRMSPQDMQTKMLKQISGYSTPCDSLYFYELINRIKNNRNQLPKLKLIFKASQDGMNAKSFWDKCKNSGPTIIFCKSRSGHVFGGYTPLKWKQDLKNNEQYEQYDDSRTSFIFSYTRKEIYPIIGQPTIICNENIGPSYGSCSPGSQYSGCQFRRSASLYFGTDFLNGISNISQKSNSFGNQKISNSDTYLMGGEKPELIEMEVFQIEGMQSINYITKGYCKIQLK